MRPRSDVTFFGLTPAHVLLIAAGSTSAVLFWIAILMTLALFGGVIIAILRRRMLGEQEPPGLLLDDIRRMRDTGEISWEEFDRLKQRIVQAVRAPGDAAPGSSDQPAPTRPRPGGESLEAPPGFDLTGEPLPKPKGGNAPDGSDSSKSDE
ncbi:MAG: SHOCT domain-containing protein [Phycisphaerales bacterium]|nr:SHOCT domain-containing protein [Phycisphaerales bacterium]